MKTNYSMLFYLKKPKNYQEGLVPVYLRITVEGKRSEVTCCRECLPSLWSAAKGRLKGNTEAVKSCNSYLDDLQSKILECHATLTRVGLPVTHESLKDLFLGRSKKPRMLMDIFKDHNRKFAALVGSEFAAGTLARYEISLRHTQSFLFWQYKIRDIDIKAINHEFVTSYEFYLRSERKCANNSAVKYIRNFRKIIRICLANGWLDRDPFANFKARIKVIDRVYLNHKELLTMSNKEFDHRLADVRDVFLFSCFTGLAYADVNKLQRNEVVTGVDGETWIFTKRKKTDIPTHIPLLPEALAIIHKHENNIKCQASGKVLPVNTNQKMNAYLKEIGAICGIEKVLTFHVARHTFATTVTLSNGVPIESVSKMLGHTNMKTTQHYAKVLDLKVGIDMLGLKSRLAAK